MDKHVVMWKVEHRVWDSERHPLPIEHALYRELLIGASYRSMLHMDYACNAYDDAFANYVVKKNFQKKKFIFFFRKFFS